MNNDRDIHYLLVSSQICKECEVWGDTNKFTPKKTDTTRLISGIRFLNKEMVRCKNDLYISGLKKDQTTSRGNLGILIDFLDRFELRDMTLGVITDQTVLKANINNISKGNVNEDLVSRFRALKRMKLQNYNISIQALHTTEDNCREDVIKAFKDFSLELGNMLNSKVEGKP